MTKYIATLLAVLLTACGGHAPTSETYLGTGGSPEAGAPGDDPTAGNDDTGGNHTGGNSPTGGSSGTSTGGTEQDPTGGATTGGNATGGSQTGGMSGEAGAATGGDSTGGTETGGTVTTGGTSTGGTTTGGSQTGGTSTTGGTGGTETGGTADTGGSQTGGTSGTGGTATGGTGGTVDPSVCNEATQFTYKCDGLDRLRCQYTTEGLLEWAYSTTCPEGPNGCYNGQCADCPADARACSTEGDAIICAPDDTGKYVWSLDEECLFGCAVTEGLCHECELGKWSCGANVSQCEVTGGQVNRMVAVLTGTTAEPAVDRCYFGCNEDEGCLRTNPWMTPTPVLIDGVNTAVPMLHATGKVFYGVKIEPGTDPQAVCAANGHFWTNGSTGYWVDAGFVSAAWTVGSGWMFTAGETAVGLNPTGNLTLNRVFPDDLPLGLFVRVRLSTYTEGDLRVDCGSTLGTVRTPTASTHPNDALNNQPFVYDEFDRSRGTQCSGDRQIRVTGFDFSGELDHVYISGGYPTIWTGITDVECVGTTDENIIPYDNETCADEWVLTPPLYLDYIDYTEDGEIWRRIGAYRASTRTTAPSWYLVNDEATGAFKRIARYSDGETFTDPAWIVCSNQENDSPFIGY